MARSLYRLVVVVSILFGVGLGGCDDSSQPQKRVEYGVNVTGTIRDSLMGTPIDSVTITHQFLHPTDDTLIVFNTFVGDSSGWYSVGMPQSLFGQLLFEKEGYRSKLHELTNEAAQTDRYNYHLDVLMARFAHGP